MRWQRTILLCGFVVLFWGGASTSLFGYLYNTSRLADSAISPVLPQILRSWDTNAISTNAVPQVQATIKTDAFTKKWRNGAALLGAYQRHDLVGWHVDIASNGIAGPGNYAVLTYDVDCERGQMRVQLTATRVRGVWKITSFDWSAR